MAFQQSLGQLRTAVSTYSALPLSGNTKGDIRITLDLGVAYTWTSEAGSGTWVDWKKVTVSSYNDLQGKPSSSPLAIDTAAQAIRNIYLNYVYMFYVSVIAISQNVMKMFEGMMDLFKTETGIDLTKTSDQRRLDVVGASANIAYYRNDFDGSLDEYTKLLILGRNYNDELQELPEGEGGMGGGGGMGGEEITYASFFDELYNDILPYNTDANNDITKFGNGYIAFNGTTDYLSIPDSADLDLGSGDFTIDLWVYFNGIGYESFCSRASGPYSYWYFALEGLNIRCIDVGGNIDIQRPYTFSTATWYHIALVRSGTTFKLFVDGTQVGADFTSSDPLIDRTVPLEIGRLAVNGAYNFAGNIKNFRFSKGISRWTSNFTPSSISINDIDTKILIHGEGVNGSKNILDNCGNEVGVYGDTHIVSTSFTTQKSIQFAGTTDSYLIVPYINQDGNPFLVNGLDFTWDFWVRPDNDDAEPIIVDYSFDRTIGGAFKIERLADKKIKVSIVGCSEYYYDMKWYPVDPVSYDVTSVNTIEKEVWSHIALVRSAGYLKLFINGNLEATSSVADNQEICRYKNEMYVPYYEGGCAFRIGYDFTGRMEEIRFSKGIARWTSSFTPRTIPYNTPTESSPCNNMIMQSNGYEASSIPSSARVVIFEQDAVLSYEPEDVESITPNTDIKVYISRDGGTTFTQATDLKYEFNIYQEVVWGSIYNNINFLVGTVDLSTQPNGKEIVWKITTHNNKDLLIRSVAVNWK